MKTSKWVREWKRVNGNGNGKWVREWKRLNCMRGVWV